VWALYPAARVRNWSQFVKGAKSVWVKCENEKITLFPTISEGGNKGFAFLADKARTIPEATSDLGAAMLAAFADSE
jgi:hypothetical protein